MAYDKGAWKSLSVAEQKEWCKNNGLPYSKESAYLYEELAFKNNFGEEAYQNAKAKYGDNALTYMNNANLDKNTEDAFREKFLGDSNYEYMKDYDPETKRKLITYGYTNDKDLTSKSEQRKSERDQTPGFFKSIGYAVADVFKDWDLNETRKENNAIIHKAENQDLNKQAEQIYKSQEGADFNRELLLNDDNLNVAYDQAVKNNNYYKEFTSKIKKAEDPQFKAKIATIHQIGMAYGGKEYADNLINGVLEKYVDDNQGTLENIFNGLKGIGIEFVAGANQTIGMFQGDMFDIFKDDSNLNPESMFYYKNKRTGQILRGDDGKIVTGAMNDVDLDEYEACFGGTQGQFGDLQKKFNKFTTKGIINSIRNGGLSDSKIIDVDTDESTVQTIVDTMSTSGQISEMILESMIIEAATMGIGTAATAANISAKIGQSFSSSIKYLKAIEKATQEFSTGARSAKGINQLLKAYNAENKFAKVAEWNANLLVSAKNANAEARGVYEESIMSGKEQLQKEWQREANEIIASEINGKVLSDINEEAERLYARSGGQLDKDQIRQKLISEYKKSRYKDVMASLESRDAEKIKALDDAARTAARLDWGAEFVKEVIAKKTLEAGFMKMANPLNNNKWGFFRFDPKKIHDAKTLTSTVKDMTRLDKWVSRGKQFIGEAVDEQWDTLNADLTGGIGKGLRNSYFADIDAGGRMDAANRLYFALNGGFNDAAHGLADLDNYYEGLLGGLSTLFPMISVAGRKGSKRTKHETGNRVANAFLNTKDFLSNNFLTDNFTLGVNQEIEQMKQSEALFKQRLDLFNKTIKDNDEFIRRFNDVLDFNSRTDENRDPFDVEMDNFKGEMATLRLIDFIEENKDVMSGNTFNELMSLSKAARDGSLTENQAKKAIDLYKEHNGETEESNEEILEKFKKNGAKLEEIRNKYKEKEKEIKQDPRANTFTDAMIHERVTSGLAIDRMDSFINDVSKQLGLENTSDKEDDNLLFVTTKKKAENISKLMDHRIKQSNDKIDSLNKSKEKINETISNLENKIKKELDQDKKSELKNELQLEKEKLGILEYNIKSENENINDCNDYKKQLDSFDENSKVDLDDNNLRSLNFNQLYSVLYNSEIEKYKETLNEYDDQISKYDELLSNTKNDEERIKLQNTINYLKGEKDKLVREYEGVDRDTQVNKQAIIQSLLDDFQNQHKDSIDRIKKELEKADPNFQGKLKSLVKAEQAKILEYKMRDFYKNNPDAHKYLLRKLETINKAKYNAALQEKFIEIILKKLDTQVNQKDRLITLFYLNKKNIDLLYNIGAINKFEYSTYNQFYNFQTAIINFKDKKEKEFLETIENDDNLSEEEKEEKIKNNSSELEESLDNVINGVVGRFFEENKDFTKHITFNVSLARFTDENMEGMSDIEFEALREAFLSKELIKVYDYNNIRKKQDKILKRREKRRKKEEEENILKEVEQKEESNEGLDDASEEIKEYEKQTEVIDENVTEETTEEKTENVENENEKTEEESTKGNLLEIKNENGESEFYPTRYSIDDEEAKNNLYITTKFSSMAEKMKVGSANAIEAMRSTFYNISQLVKNILDYNTSKENKQFKDFLLKNNINFNNIADGVLYKILEKNPKVKFVEVNPHLKELEGCDTHHLLGVEYTPEIQNIWKESDGNVITYKKKLGNGEFENVKYLLIGDLNLGKDRNKYDAYFNGLSLNNKNEGRIAKRRNKYFADSNKTGTKDEIFYVDSDYYTEINHITKGYLIFEDQDKKREDVVSLNSLLENPDKNPHDYTSNNITLFFHFNGDLYKNDNDNIIVDSENINGNGLFIAIKNGFGENDLAKVTYKRLGELKKDSPAARYLSNQIKGESAFKMIEYLQNIFPFKENASIFTDSTGQSIKIKKDSIVVKEMSIDDLKENPSKLIEALIDEFPEMQIINNRSIKNKEFVSELIKSDMINTNLARLATYGSNFSVKEIMDDVEGYHERQEIIKRTTEAAEEKKRNKNGNGNGTNLNKITKTIVTTVEYNGYNYILYNDGSWSDGGLFELDNDTILKLEGLRTRNTVKPDYVSKNIYYYEQDNDVLKIDEKGNQTILKGQEKENIIEKINSQNEGSNDDIRRNNIRIKTQQQKTKKIKEEYKNTIIFADWGTGKTSAFAESKDDIVDGDNIHYEIILESGLEGELKEYQRLNGITDPKNCGSYIGFLISNRKQLNGASQDISWSKMNYDLYREKYYKHCDKYISEGKTVLTAWIGAINRCSVIIKHENYEDAKQRVLNPERHNPFEYKENIWNDRENRFNNINKDNNNIISLNKNMSVGDIIFENPLDSSESPFEVKQNDDTNENKQKETQTNKIKEIKVPIKVKTKTLTIDDFVNKYGYKLVSKFGPDTKIDEVKNLLKSYLGDEEITTDNVKEKLDYILTCI